LMEGGHYSAYLEQFDLASRAALEWFQAHL
jgi:hypothetical protein